MAATDLDLGPLSWVKGEIDLALGRASEALAKFIENSADSAQLKFAQTHLHQAHGALSIVGLDGITQFSETIEQLLGDIEKGQVPASAEMGELAQRALASIRHYLDELATGSPNQPLKLLNVYRELLTARGVERAASSDLFFPDLTQRPPKRAQAAAPLSPEQLKAERARFERGFLKWLRNAQDVSGLAEMREAVAAIEATQALPSARAFWWITLGLFDALMTKQIPVDLHVKKVCVRVDLQMRRLMEGSKTVAERLMRDALYFVAVAQGEKGGGDLIQQVKQVYQLDELVPTNAANIEPLKPLLRNMRDTLTSAKDAWNKFCAGAAVALPQFHDSVVNLANNSASGLLNDQLVHLMAVLSETAQWLRKDPLKQSESLSMEVATALLLAESALENYEQLSPDFPQQVDLVAGRLNGLMDGQTLSPSDAPLLDEMSKRAQERLLMSQVAREILINLVQIEQTLDAFFRDSEKRSDLDQLATPLKQVYGALSIIGQDDALTLLRGCAASIQSFATPGYQPAEGEFEAVAHKLSGLGFFVEALQHGPADLETILQPVQAKAQAQAAPDEVAEESALAPSVENELEQQQRDTQALVEALREKPEDAGVREELKLSLETIRQDASLVANLQLEQEAKAALAALAAGADASESDLAAAMARVAPTAPMEFAAPSAETIRLSEAPTEEVDAELLEIFLEEAREVILTIAEHIELSRSEPHNHEYLITVRRGFHTLKGSGRMVGLNDLGEAAWAVEQVMNKWLQAEQDTTPVLFKLIEDSLLLFGAWVAQLESNGGTYKDASALIAAAESFRTADDGSVVNTSNTDEAPVNGSVEDVTESIPTEEVEALELEGIEVLQEAEPSFEIATDSFSDTAATLSTESEKLEKSEEIEFAAFEFDAPSDTSLDAPVIELAELPALELSDESLNASFLDATPTDAGASADIEAEITATLPIESTEEFDLSLPEEITGSAVETNYETQNLNADEPADPLSDALADSLAPASVDTLDTIGTTDTPPPSDTVMLGDVVVSRSLYEMYMVEARSHINTLRLSLNTLKQAPQLPPEDMLRAAHTLAGISGTVGVRPLSRLAMALEHALDRLTRSGKTSNSKQMGLLGSAVSTLEAMVAAVAEQRVPDGADGLANELDEVALSLHRPPVELSIVPPLVSVVEEIPEVIPALTPAPAEELAADAFVEDPLANSFEEPAVELFAEPLAENTSDDPAPSTEPVAAPVVDFVPETIAEVASAPERPQLHMKDDLDEQLLPIFLEEAVELMRDIGSELRNWHDTPNDKKTTDALARLMHTLKGSARMAGAMTMGELIHDMESRIELAVTSNTVTPFILEEIDNAYDHANFLIDGLQKWANGEVVELEEVTGASVAPASAGTGVSTPAAAAPVQGGIQIVEVDEQAAARAVLRVRADLVDRLVNEAGEMSIARSRIEGEMRALRQSLLDLTENVIRLRGQLREIEIQAESQIQSQQATTESVHPDFDPLEFDRFTRFQEITRMMAESVNDVTTVQHALLRNLDHADAAIVSQARQNRELSQALMSVRMVPFNSVADRVYRVVRQTAKELGKKANLDIRGGQVELDRSVLEKMTGPIEHLLRNAITHGLEDKDRRLSADKPEIGQISLSIIQAGNEIVIEMADDGAGINVERIRAKAIEQGLITAHDQPDETTLINFIYHPGFSTANELTELAGRGVGMDVVKSEAAELGGRIETTSELGKGARFRIYLPLTLTVAQALLVRVGSRSYAIPSVMVDQVFELKPAATDKIRAEGAAEWMGERYPFYFLPRLLGDGHTVPEPQRRESVLLLRSGTQRVSIQVDELRGNQEIVIKNIGPQLARVIGISGATVLGNGDVVLILNPIALASRELAALKSDGSGTAVPVSVAPPVQKLPMVMIVDDSLTVRKITSRLLSREGYHVLTAKDGVDALEQLLDFVPAVMLVDIEMPRMDGFDLTRNVRADERLKGIPIIMITSRTADKHRNYAMEIGANHYLGKPYQEDELLGLIGKYTGHTNAVKA